MADSHSPDSEPTTRTLLRRVLDTADPRTPRRPRSARIGYIEAVGSSADPVWRGKQFRKGAEPRALRTGSFPLAGLGLAVCVPTPEIPPLGTSELFGGPLLEAKNSAQNLDFCSVFQASFPACAQASAQNCLSGSSHLEDGKGAGEHSLGRSRKAETGKMLC